MKHDIFIQEILLMMYSFGDSSKPLRETAVLIRKVVLQELISVIKRLDAFCVQCSIGAVSLKEVLFLYRKDYGKLLRIINYLKFKDLKSTAMKYVKLDSTKEQENEEDIFQTKTNLQTKSRLNYCLEYFHDIDPTGHIAELIENESYEDALKKKRDKRLEKMTRDMTSQQYIAFSEARQSSFASHNNHSKFSEWLFSSIPSKTTTPIDPNLVEVLAYLAYEFVGEIVELALLVKEERRFVQSSAHETSTHTGIGKQEVMEAYRRNCVSMCPLVL